MFLVYHESLNMNVEHQSDGNIFTKQNTEKYSKPKQYTNIYQK